LIGDSGGLMDSEVGWRSEGCEHPTKSGLEHHH